MTTAPDHGNPTKNPLHRALMSCTRFHHCIGFALPILLLVSVAACAPPPPKEPLEERPAVEHIVTRLNDGRQGFSIEEHTAMDGTTRSDFTKAVTMMGQGQYDKAIVLMEQVIAQAPELTAPHIDIALAYEKKGETEKAEKHLKTALELVPGHPVASNIYGLLLRKNGHFTEAGEIFEASLKRFPEYLPARKNLGILYELYLGNLAAALKQYEIYSEATPEDEEVTTWIASVRQRLEAQ